MAKVYRSPIKFEQEYDGDWREWEKRENKYLEELIALAKTNSPRDKLAGEILRWGRGDGYAQYMVWK